MGCSLENNISELRYTSEQQTIEYITVFAIKIHFLKKSLIYGIFD